MHPNAIGVSVPQSTFCCTWSPRQLRQANDKSHKKGNDQTANLKRRLDRPFLAFILRLSGHHAAQLAPKPPKRV